MPTAIFEGKKARPLLEAPRDRAPEQPRNAAVRAASILWDEADDVVLKRLMGDYGRNWRLIADLFNSARNTISTDKRSAWDCYHRWDQKWGPSKAAAAAASNAAAPGEPLLTPAQQELQQARAQAQAMAIANHAQSGSTGPPPAPAAITIPPLAPVAPAALPASAIPTTASVTVGEESVNPDGATSPGAARREAKLQREARYQGSKKKVRNNTMRDAIRRSQKRRDINRKNNSKSILNKYADRKLDLTCSVVRDAVDGQQVVTIHESHTGFLAQRGAPVPSPQELSQLQAERFAAEQEKLRNMRLAELRQQQLAQQQRLQQVQMQQHQAQQHQQQMQQARASQTPQNQTNVQTGGAGSTPQLTANPPTAGTGRQPPTPGAAQQIVMQQSQMVTQALQQAAQQQIQQQGPGNNGVPGAVNTGSTPNPTVNAQGGAISANQQPRAQITAPNVITLANGTRLTVPVNQGSPNLRMQNQAQQHIVQQRTANGGSGSPVNTVQGQPGSAQGSPHLNGQNASRPASRTGQSNAPNSQGGAVRPGQPGATGQGAPRQGQAINHNQAVITSLLQKAGMSTLNHIPIPPKPDGGQWTATEIVQQQVAYLHVSGVV
jgi:chromatin modification-related protein VID21